MQRADAGLGLAVVGVLLWMVLPQLVTSITSLVDSMDLYMNEISGWVASLLHNNPEIEHSFMRLYDQFSTQIMNWAQNDLLPQLGNMMSGVVTTVNVLMNLLIGVIIALYILNSKDTFCAQAKKMTYSLFAVEKANAIMARVAHIHRVFGGFITGKLMDSSIIGVLCFIGMRLMISFGWMTMPTSYALLIAVIIGVTNIIPFFGPFIGAIPSTILIMVISPVQALYFVIFVLLLQQFDGNILGPKILGNATGLSSFWVMFAILLFGGVMGFAGMVVGVPLFAVLYSMLTEKINHLLKIYYAGKEIALHSLCENAKGEHVTDKSHYPSNKTITQEELLSRYREKMSAVGEGALAFLEAFRQTEMYQCHHYRSISGILALCKRYGNDAVDKACARACHYGNITYRSVKKICESGLYNLPLENESERSVNGNSKIRNLADYRKMTELGGDQP